MGKYFGTDGIRGVANEGLDLKKAYDVGAYLADYYGKEKRAKIAICKDTRLSSSMFEHALASAISAQGGDAYLMGYATTPSLAYVVSHEDFDCGVMISASHNPYYDNGIKVFAPNGLKIDASIEEKIESLIDQKISLKVKTHDAIGRVYDYKEGVDHYIAWLDKTFDLDLSKLKLAIDLANGGACFTAKRTLENLKANMTIINDEPNGVNINDHCGSTHLEGLCDLVKKGDYDLGFAFDGDADRVLFVNGKGEVIDGDKIMYLLAKHLKAENMLTNNMLVTTVMSNIGLLKALKRADIDYCITAVGDKNVADQMVKNDYAIGGEQSGHIINKHSGMFGDGLKTALNVLQVLVKSGQTIDELTSDVKIFPQLLINQKVKDKNIVLDDSDIKALVEDISSRLGDDGRILVRPSGTEPLIRVMVEAKDDKTCHDLVYEVIDLIKAKGYGA